MIQKARRKGLGRVTLSPDKYTEWFEVHPEYDHELRQDFELVKSKTLTIEDDPSLYVAVKTGDSAQVDVRFEQDPNLAKRLTKMGKSYLTEAAYFGHKEVCKTICDAMISSGVILTYSSDPSIPNRMPVHAAIQGALENKNFATYSAIIHYLASHEELKPKVQYKVCQMLTFCLSCHYTDHEYDSTRKDLFVFLCTEVIREKNGPEGWLSCFENKENPYYFYIRSWRPEHLIVEMETKLGLTECVGIPKKKWRAIEPVTKQPTKRARRVTVTTPTRHDLLDKDVEEAIGALCAMFKDAGLGPPALTRCYAESLIQIKIPTKALLKKKFTRDSIALMDVMTGPEVGMDEDMADLVFEELAKS